MTDPELSPTLSTDSETNPLDSQIAQQPWRALVFSPAAWARHSLFVLASIGVGLASLVFYYAEHWRAALVPFLTGKASWAGLQIAGPWTVIMPALTLAIAMVVIMRLRDCVFPGTQGTGIPQVIAALEVPEPQVRSHMLSWRIAIGKLLLLIIAIMAGATVGREGPSVHVGACLMYLAASYVRYPSWLVRRGLIVGGGAAGIGAAFNAPIAATIFAFEEIGRSFDKNSAGTIVRTVAIACVTCVVFLGNYYFYGRLSTGFGSAAQWLLIIPISVIGGLLGGLFASAVLGGTRIVNRNNRTHPWRTAGLIGLCLAVLGIVSQGHSYGSGFTEAQAILVHGTPYPWYYPFVKALASFGTLISGIPGGLFDPSLSVGAGLGQLTAHWLPNFDTNTIILMFMVAYFAGVVQSPITAFVILIEMTGARNMTLPLMLTSIIAYSFSHLVCKVGLYEALAELSLADIKNKP